MKYRIILNIEKIIEADSEDEALDIVYELFEENELDISSSEVIQL